MNWRRLAAVIYTAVLTAVVAHAEVCYCSISSAPVVNCNTHLRRNPTFLVPSDYCNKVCDLEESF
ncbi:hypothetical protein PR003_g26653 [Phytophthora rubi]|uniref:Uncharacterized protein n=1 Tax=Phytophthora rubi TaxID=129364 RepID=A0A6A3HS83_9STRA|nr:hypothetical protein PR001_g27243 [Phytophthora rubi]KAE8971555.1 hypothetical protein PR002_g26784 [Phytophthora rubi]KAE9285185.1 hypothetical protein PR003_g26653 [Phytophthora rubi]